MRRLGDEGGHGSPNVADAAVIEVVVPEDKVDRHRESAVERAQVSLDARCLGDVAREEERRRGARDDGLAQRHDVCHRRKLEMDVGRPCQPGHAA